ncbi:hypothetical protein O3P69_005226 [Scylla paramamosain]|uniref:Uncharacterized protein n=1 Tax=Scylla paramamosain TaxID=85552 RepID=A0AAW0U7C6_SCYPA
MRRVRHTTRRLGAGSKRISSQRATTRSVAGSREFIDSCLVHCSPSLPINVWRYELTLHFGRHVLLVTRGPAVHSNSSLACSGSAGECDVTYEQDMTAQGRKCGVNDPTKILAALSRRSTVIVQLGVKGDRFTSESRWLWGPSFLSLDERDWPTYPQQISDLSDTDPKVRKECTVLTLQSNGEEDSIKTLITRSSSWHCLLVIGTQILDENRLHTVFCNVEETVNGRPLTPNPNDLSDLEPLTPLHLLRTESITVDTGKEPHISETYRRKGVADFQDSGSLRDPGVRPSSSEGPRAHSDSQHLAQVAGR